MAQNTDSPTLYHVSAHGLCQPVREPRVPYKARRMGSEETIEFVAADYQQARLVALAMWPGSVVAVWGNAPDDNETNV